MHDFTAQTKVVKGSADGGSGVVAQHFRQVRVQINSYPNAGFKEFFRVLAEAVAQFNRQRICRLFDHFQVQRRVVGRKADGVVFYRLEFRYKAEYFLKIGGAHLFQA